MVNGPYPFILKLLYEKIKYFLKIKIINKMNKNIFLFINGKAIIF